MKNYAFHEKLDNIAQQEISIWAKFGSFGKDSNNHGSCQEAHGTL